MNTKPYIELSQSLMVNTPNIYCLVKGSSEGNTPLNAFDNALLNAGIGDTNLMRMSSIVPPGCKEVNKLSLPAGGLIPLAYASLESIKKGEIISAAIAVGIPEDLSLPGVIMEHEDTRPLDMVEAKARKMVEDAFKYRNRPLKEIKSIGSEIIVNKCGAVFAGAVLWYE